MSASKCAHRIKTIRREQRIAAGTWIPRQPAEPLRLHVESLRQAGMSVTAIAAASGVPTGTLYNLIYRRTSEVYGETAARLLALTAPAPRPPAGMVDATGPRRRAQSLAAIGHSLRAQRQRTGIGGACYFRLIAGRTSHICARNAEAIAAMFADWAAKPGTSKVAVTWALRQGWVPPLAWDDIDEPTETPNLDGGGSEPIVDEVVVARVIAGKARYTDLDDANRFAVVEYYTARGLTPQQVASRVKTSALSVRKLLAQPPTAAEAA